MFETEEVNWLGAVAIDLQKKEREFKNLTLSDENVVKYLILYRSKLDVTYKANTNINFNQAGDVFEFNQELICLYASLDKIIEKVIVDEKELKFLSLLFEGNTITDTINVYKHYPKMTTYRAWSRIIEIIIKENNYNWKMMLTETVLKGD